MRHRLKPAAVAVSAAILTLAPSGAEAYIGPGIGAGAIAAVLGVVGSILVALFAILYYPIKRALRRRKGRAAEPETSGSGDAAADTQEPRR